MLDGSTTVYDQTFNLAFSDPLVQAAVASAQAALTGAAAPAGVSFSGPTQTSSSTTLLGASTATVVTSSTSSLITTLEDTIGPGTIIIGNRDLGGTVFEVLAGTTNVNINSHTRTDIFRTLTTTSTFLTTAVWTLFGTTQTGGGGGGTVAEPGTLALALPMIGLLIASRRRRGSTAVR